MPGDPKICREHAAHCWALAADIRNPELRNSIEDIARRWTRLAADLEFTRQLLEEWGVDEPKSWTPNSIWRQIGTGYAKALLA